MKNVSVATTIAIFAMTLISGCGPNYNPETEPAGEEPSLYDLSTASAPSDLTPTYKSISGNIFGPKCVKCHKAGGLQPDVMNYSDLLARKWVVPGDPDKSPLFESLAAGKMPPGNHLSDIELQTVGQWIKDGAPNN